MNQILILVVIAVVVLGGGYFLLAGNNASDDSIMEKDGEEMMEHDDVMMRNEGAMMDDKKMEDGAMMEDGGTEMMEKDDAMTKEGSGSYEVYSADKLARASEGDVVLFFRATWCPTCKVLHENIQANPSGIPAGLTILDVDYDKYTELKQQYGVTYQHTLVQVDAEGNLIKKWSGSPTLSALVAEVS